MIAKGRIRLDSPNNARHNSRETFPIFFDIGA
jgi:hypothetical protein